MAACSDPHRPHHSDLVEVSRPLSDAEGLRDLLRRLHDAGAGAWRTDPDASEVMRLCADRYAALARKHGQEPIEAAAAAFEAMQADATRTATDPWAVVTVAVRRSLIAEQRAAALLTSPGRARRSGTHHLHDPLRFGDQTVELADHHPAFHITDQPAGDTEAGMPTVVVSATRLLVRLGWPAGPAWTLVELVCARTADLGSRAAAYEVLRRDKAVRAHLDLPHRCWIGLLRTLLGHPGVAGPLGQGILARLLTGETVEDLLTDAPLVALAGAAVPTGRPAVAR
jgi:phosphoribosyl-ATP pyrophosphohydrolase